MGKTKIVCSGPLPKWAAELLGAGYELAVARSQRKEDLLGLLHSHTRALIARSSTVVDRELMEAAPSLEVIGRTGVGYDSIDVAEATRRGILVLYTPDAVALPTAEHAVALILAAAKDLLGWNSRARSGAWQERNRRFNLDLRGAVLGIVGYGRIGRLVHRLLKPLMARILICDPFLPKGSIKGRKTKQVDLEKLLAWSDIVTLHVPLNDETRGLINSNNIGRMRKGALLVNAARGGLIESNALLVKALDEGVLGGVALDVLEQEPPDPNEPLVQHPQALISCHVASRTPLCQTEIVSALLDDIQAVLEGRKPYPGNVVNPAVLRERDDLR